MASWNECPEAMQHGPADGKGRCPWCHQKYTYEMPHGPGGESAPLTTSELAYSYYFDPDFGIQREDVYTSERPVRGEGSSH